jgi:hypothetical protein
LDAISEVDAMSGAGWDSQLLNTLWQAEGHDPLALLLLRDMALIADEHGHAPLVTLATRFRNFFRKRRAEGKAELAAGDVDAAASPAEPGEWTVEWWTEDIVNRALDGMNRQLMHRVGEDMAWNAASWSSWSPGFRKALRNIAEAKLIEYFERRVAGGW